jgi:hypothetical protein
MQKIRFYPILVYVRHLQRYRFLFFVCFFCILSGATTPASAMGSTGIVTGLTAGLGVEYLEYEEQLAETALESSVDLSNIVARIEGMKRLKNVFIGFQVAIPVVSNDSGESWFKNATLDQTDSLKYEIVHFAPFIGYSFTPLFNPYLGTRSTWSNQERSDFRAHDGAVVSSAKITEEVFAQFISLGFRGGLPVSEKLHVTYGVEYGFPYYSKVTNDGLPGWKATDVDGYLWRAHVEMFYVLRETLSLGLLLCTGRQHWEGSDWQNYPGGRGKWPENDTIFFNSYLNFNWYF